MRKEYYEFDPQIFPRMLWVVIGNAELVKDNFCTYQHDEIDVKDLGECAGATAAVRSKKNDLKGSVIFIPSQSLSDTNTMAHEAVHATNNIFNDLRIEFNYNDDENHAYMVGWVAGCVQKAINEYKKG